MRDEPEKKIETLFAWNSAYRPFKRRDTKWYLTVAVLICMPVVIALLFQDWVPAGVLFALLFVLYVLASVPPEQVKHKITTQGINTGSHSYLWSEMNSFWVTEVYGNPMLHVELKRFAPNLVLLVHATDLERVKSLLVQYIPFREIPEQSWVEKAAGWFGGFLPFAEEKK